MLLAAVATSVLFTSPVPLDMPRATAYLVRDGDAYGLEDRYCKLDLWVSRSVDGRWIDDDGREFRLARLDVLPPAGPEAEAVSTRVGYVRTRTPIDKRDKAALRTAIAALSPVEIPEKESRPRRLPRGFRDIDYWQGTNTSAIVCAYLPEKSDTWRLATWQLAEGDDFRECLDAFGRELFDERAGLLPSAAPEGKGERELLRADARHSVAAYPNWHVTDAREFTVLDDLPPSSSFVASLTNDLPVMRARYAEALPTRVDGSNALCVARIFADREEYLDALAADGLTNMAWTAAYWSPSRRELVAHFDPRPQASGASSAESLLRTVRHEALHQYLSYAAAMIPVSPWLNEGYAQYFEDGGAVEGGEGDAWELPGGRPSADDLERYSLLLPGLMMMDYAEFYAGGDDERRLKYRLAWSLAVFLERGAPKVRFRPFKDVKKNYFAALFETRDMRQATIAAFKGVDRGKFAGEWLAYWKSRQ